MESDSEDEDETFIDDHVSECEPNSNAIIICMPKRKPNQRQRRRRREQQCTFAKCNNCCTHCEDQHGISNGEFYTNTTTHPHDHYTTTTTAQHREKVKFNEEVRNVAMRNALREEEQMKLDSINKSTSLENQQFGEIC